MHNSSEETLGAHIEELCDENKKYGLLDLILITAAPTEDPNGECWNDPKERPERGYVLRELREKGQLDGLGFSHRDIKKIIAEIAKGIKLDESGEDQDLFTQYIAHAKSLIESIRTEAGDVCLHIEEDQENGNSYELARLIHTTAKSKLPKKKIRLLNSEQKEVKSLSELIEYTRSAQISCINCENIECAFRKEPFQER